MCPFSYHPSSHHAASPIAVAKLSPWNPEVAKYSLLHSWLSTQDSFISLLHPLVILLLPSSLLVLLFPLKFLNNHKLPEILQIQYKELFFPEFFEKNLPTWCPSIPRYNQGHSLT